MSEASTAKTIILLPFGIEIQGKKTLSQHEIAIIKSKSLADAPNTP